MKNAIKRFGDDLNKLSGEIKAKTNEQIKVNLKRKMCEDAGVPVNSILNSSPPKKAATAVNNVNKTPAKVITQPAGQVSLVNNSDEVVNNSIAAEPLSNSVET